MTDLRGRLRRFAVRGIFWRQFLDWALTNTPFYFQPIGISFCTLFFFFFAAPARRAILSNLRVILPGSSRWANYLRAYWTLHNFAWTISEAANYKLNDAEFTYEIEGAEYLEQLAAGKGALVLTAHMGNYDLGAGLFARKFQRELRMVRAPEPDRDTEKHLRASLQQTGAGGVKIDYNTEGTRLSFDLLNALRQGEIVSIQGDRVMGEMAQTKGQLFGRQVELPEGPFILALIAGAPIYPLFIVRVAFRNYKVIVRPPIVCVRTESKRERDVAAAVAQWCQVLEGVVRDHWDQWYAFVPFFPAHAAA